MELSTERLALFDRFSLVNNPLLPDTMLTAARAMGKERRKQFVETLNWRMEARPG